MLCGFCLLGMESWAMAMARARAEIGKLDIADVMTMFLRLFPRWPPQDLRPTAELLVALVCPRPMSAPLPSLFQSLLLRRPVRLAAAFRPVERPPCELLHSEPLGLALLRTSYLPRIRLPTSEPSQRRCSDSKLACTLHGLSFPGRLARRLELHLGPTYTAPPICLRRLLSVLASALVVLLRLR
jgi:hypothetical protein